MTRVALVIAAGAVLAFAACGRDEPHLATPKTEATAALSTTPDASATTLIAADASTPAAGACGDAPEGGIAEIALNPDVPSPRCVIVHSENQLTFVNNTNTVVTVNVGYDSGTLEPHQTYVFPEHVGDHWAPGVHRVDTGSLYAGGGPEVWLQQ